MRWRWDGDGNEPAIGVSRRSFFRLAGGLVATLVPLPTLAIGKEVFDAERDFAAGVFVASTTGVYQVDIYIRAGAR